MEEIQEARGLRFISNNNTSKLEIPTSIREKGDWEPFESDIFEDVLKEGMNVLDLGANMGWYSFLAARKIGSGKVFSFEADPYTYELFLKHIDLNNIKNITPIKKAASDKAGTIRFYSYHDSMRDGKSGFFVREFPTPPKEVEVETVTVDEYMKETGVKIDLVKMDIEGAEFRALKGMKNMIQDVRFLFTEVNAETMVKAGVSYEEFYNLLTEYGFSVQFINEAKKELVDIKVDNLKDAVEGSPRKWINLFCKK